MSDLGRLHWKSLRLFGRVLFLVDVLSGGVEWIGEGIDVVLEFVGECMIIGLGEGVSIVVGVFGCGVVELIGIVCDDGGWIGDIPVDACLLGGDIIMGVSFLVLRISN
ncbi:hypothetical protein Tco_1240350 [Tanacetum coccineum]